MPLAASLWARWPRVCTRVWTRSKSVGRTSLAAAVIARELSAFTVEEIRDGSRTNSGWAHVEPWIRIDEYGAAAPDRKHGRQGRAG